ncbi:serine/threonine-protein phosphatase [bacterium]|nr:serine/threonine-protein phosphatase [bacterium]
MAISIILATAFVKHRRRISAYQHVAVQELQDANEMQMSLMPETAPEIEGVEIAGKCIPANTVSGDFFDYLEGKHPNEIGLVIADVSGKAMKGAMNAVMADGILRASAQEIDRFSPAFLMMKVNNVLKGRMEQYMNVTMVIGVIDSDANTLKLTNAAHHAYPLLLREGEIQTLKGGGLPLGMRVGIKYSEERFPLQTGDVLFLMTDGIIEAQDSEGQMYSDSGRLDETISKFTLDLSAEAMVEAIINDAIDFGGDKTARDDDMTVVVAKIK